MPGTIQLDEAPRITPREFLYYQPGDTLEIYKPGDTIGPENKSWTMLFLKIDSISWSLDFPRATPHLVTRIVNNYRNHNLVYFGDLVTESAKTLAATQHYEGYDVSPFGKGSMRILQDFLRSTGLCLDLNVRGGWPIDNTETIARSACYGIPYYRTPEGHRRNFYSVRHYLKDVVRPGG